MKKTTLVFLSLMLAVATMTHCKKKETLGDKVDKAAEELDQAKENLLGQ